MATTPYDTACNADSPSHAFLLNEASGSPVDSVGSITTTATALSYGTASWLMGEKAIGFNGTTSKIALGSAIVTGTTYTIEMLLFPQAGNAYGSIGSQADVKGLYYNSGSTKLLDFFDGVGDNRNTTVFNESIWAVHIAFVVSGTSCSFYVNGVLDGTFTAVGTMSLDSIGNDPSSEAFKGLISRWRFYPTALSAAKIQAHFAALNTPSVNAVAALNPPATLDYSAASITASDTSKITVIGDITGTTPAAVFKGAYGAVSGTNSQPTIAISSGKIVIPYIGSVGSVAVLMTSNGGVWGANDSGNASTGAAFCNFSGSTTSAQIVTSSGGTDGAVNNSGDGVGTIQPIVCICTFDDAAKVARITINGTAYSASYVGTPKTSVALELFGNYASGIPGTASGNLYRVAIWATPLTTAQDKSITSQLMPLVFGTVPSHRYFRAAFHGASEQNACIDFSDDATTFTGGRIISYLAGAGDVRDVGLYYHKANNTFYAFHTAYIASSGNKFRIAKFSPSNPLLWTLHAEVDCSSLGGAGGGAPEPVVDPATGLIKGVTLQGWNEAAFYYLPITDITVPSYGSFTAITGTTNPVSDSFVLYPTDPRNIFSPGKYVMLWSSVPGSSPRWSDSTTITGSYTTEHITSFPTNYEGSGAILLDNGKVRWFSSLLGASTWEYLDFDGTTYSSPAAVNSTDIGGNAFDPGQGDVIDLKPLGLWPVAVAGGRASLGISLSLSL